MTTKVGRKITKTRATVDEVAASAAIYQENYIVGHLNRYHDPADGDDYTEAWQTALDVFANSAYNANGGVIRLPEDQQYLDLTAAGTCDRGNLQVIGASQRGGLSVFRPQGNYPVFKHSRTSSLSGAIVLSGFSIDGGATGIRDGLHIEDCNYLRTDRITIQNCYGMGTWMTNVEDAYLDIDIRKCGGVQTVSRSGVSISETATIVTGVDPNACTLSAIGAWKNNEMIRIAGAGPGGDDLDTIIRTGGGTVNLVIADAASTDVAAAVVSRIHLPLMIGDQSEGQGFAVCNSITMSGKSVLERNRAPAVVYNCRVFMTFGVKLHGRTTPDDDATPEKLSILVTDRCERVVHTSPHLTHVRWRGLLNKKSGGSLNSTFSVLGGTGMNAANYVDSDGVAFIECESGRGHIDGSVFDDDLAHASYTGANGYDVILGANHGGYYGHIQSLGSPGGGAISNGNTLRGQPMVTSNANKPAHLIGSWTPYLEGSTTPGSPTYVTQVGSIIKIGALTKLFGEIQISAKGGLAGNVKIMGLPFAASNTAPRAAGGGGYLTDFVDMNMPATHTASAGFSLKIAAGASNATIRSMDLNDASNPVTDAECKDTLKILFVLEYLADD